MTLSRRGFLKSFIAAASLTVVRHYTPAAMIAPAMQPQPLSAESIVSRMAAAMQQLPRGGRQVFYMSPAAYKRVLDLVGADSSQKVANVTIADTPAILEECNEEVDESGAMVALGADGSRTVVDVETGEELQRIPPRTLYFHGVPIRRY